MARPALRLLKSIRLFTSSRFITVLGIAALGIAAVGVLGGCSAKNASPSGITLDVYATSSLTQAFTRIAHDFESLHPEVKVVLNFGGSATLEKQISEGAPADVVAFADTANIVRLSESKVVNSKSVITFATNRLAIIVAKGNPKAIKSISDLARADVVLVLCEIAQPCGKNAATALERAKVVVEPASLELNVSGVVQKVVSGEADAGVAYITDALATNSEIDHVEIPSSINIANLYPIGIVSKITRAENNAASDFINFVVGDGATILRKFGFGAP